MLTALPYFSRCVVAGRYIDGPLKRILQTGHTAQSLISIQSLFIRPYSKEKQKGSSALTESKHSGAVSTSTTFETVKENTKTAWNLGVILLGVGVTGSIFWAIFRELFSSNSPNNIYSKALDRCIADVRVKDQLGEPIKGYGEENARGRRRHVSHSIFQRDGRNHMLMKFYVHGSRKKGTVFLEMREDDRGTFQYNFMAVQLDDLLRSRIILEDNRHQNVAGQSFSSLAETDSNLSSL